MERYLRCIWTITLVVEIYIKGTGANGVLDDALKWKGLVIPFAFSKTFLNEPDKMQLVLDAMDVFQTATCLTFIQRTTEMQYLYFFSPPNRCYSDIGKQSPDIKGQRVGLSLDVCFMGNTTGIAQHQIMHAIGFYDEQSRLDRDEYVHINWSNIEPGDQKQFQKYPSTAFGEPYDFGSVLHYGMYDFAIDPTVWTIRPKEKYRDQEIGQRDGLSATDIRKINKMYNCTKQLAATTPKLAEMDDSSRISTHCLFFTNCSYSCKTNCDSKGMPLKKAFPGNPNMRYTEYNCTDDALINGVAQWRETDGVVKKFFDLSRRNEIVTSCAFYETHWYECYGVADCSRGDQGILTCEGSAPWRGFYDRSPLQGAGWSGNVTQEAMNNGGTFQGQTVAGDLNILRTCN